MDTRIQAAEEAGQGGDGSLEGGVAGARPGAPRGRPKKLRPPPPSLTRELAVVLGHFFPQLAAWLGDVRDPRVSGAPTFPLKVLLLLGVVMFLGHSKSRNFFNDNVRGSVEMARTLARMLGVGVPAVAHLDTLEKILREADPGDLEELLARLVRRLVRMKALDGWRVSGRFLLALDGTGLYSFRKRHCEHCVETVHSSGKATYSHKLLVAFIVSADGYALPVACEFIENPGEKYVKQDCETKAFHRLAPKLKRLFPQTPFWLLLDALYADQEVMRECLANGWNFAITFKDSDMPALWREAQALLALSPGQRSAAPVPGGKGGRAVRWVNDLDYEGMRLSAIFQEEPGPGGEGPRKFAHLVGRTVDRDNCWNTAAAGRQRWRCENEGFKTLKHGGFALEHVYSRNPVAAKCYLVLMLVAHLLQQLLARGLLGGVFGEAFHTFRNYGRKLLEALRDQPLPAEPRPPGQIRLSTA